MNKYLNIVRKHLPAVDQILRQSSNVPIKDYLNSISHHPAPPFQAREDLNDIVFNLLKPLLGDSTALKIKNDFPKSPVVLTASHCGIESYAIFVQGNILFAVNALLGKTENKTVMAFSFGNVPLNNRTYPRGILLYQVNPAHLDRLPAKLPLFPVRMKRTMSCCAPSYTATMIKQSMARLRGMVSDGLISPKLERSVTETLEAYFLADDVLQLSSYSQQAVVLNNRIWHRLFKNFNSVPELVYIEIEKVVGELLQLDLSDPDSLAWHVFFNPPVREHVIATLDGLAGCWNIENLKKRMTKTDGSMRPKTDYTTGTVFFWGIDGSGRRVPMHFKSYDSHKLKLEGRDDRGTLYEMPFSADRLMEKLREKKLLPSVFTCFLSFSLARGVSGIGGCFQAEYLPKIQQAVCKALLKENLTDMAYPISQVPTDRYLPGMTGIMTQSESGRYLLPAGISEIISAGGITPDDIDQLGNLTVQDAHYSALFENLPAADAHRFGVKQQGWKKELAAAAYGCLKNRVVIK